MNTQKKASNLAISPKTEHKNRLAYRQKKMEELNKLKQKIKQLDDELEKWDKVGKE
uniref:Uncharacterized protein n=2 Tax=Meloidogyne TaxID=189290 RepID=A0A6V7WKH9_MELEN|nr:unnamed protein product [Meloidogyne enterolobii]